MKHRKILKISEGFWQVFLCSCIFPCLLFLNDSQNTAFSCAWFFASIFIFCAICTQNLRKYPHNLIFKENSTFPGFGPFIFKHLNRNLKNNQICNKSKNWFIKLYFGNYSKRATREELKHRKIHQKCLQDFLNISSVL